MSDPAAISYWLETAGDDLSPRPPLDRSTDADVAVVGAGYTGLWTAWYLLQRDPALRVLVCEAETAGFGASGRNGAWCAPSLGVTPGELARRTSADLARRTVRVMRETVAEIGRVCAAEGLDIGFRPSGVLRVARGRHEVPHLDAAWAQLQHLRLADGCDRLDAAAVAQRVRVAQAEGGLLDRYGAVIHPGKLVRGLARLVERAGGRIVEGTQVTDVAPRTGSGGQPRVRTDRGDVRADVVVLAGEAWISQLPGRRRDVLPLYSLIVLTEPLSPERWATIGWDGAECLASHRYTVDYLSRASGGRILFGGRGAPYHYGSRIQPRFDRHGATHARLRRELLDWFPGLRGVRFTHEWGGPMAMPRDWLPTFRYDPRTGIAGAWGYTGQGVAAANLAGRVLADLVTGADSDLLDLPMVDHRPPRWEPEPLRWAAVRYLQTALARLDARGQRTGRPPSGRSLAERLIRH
jgi:glycine/D-amino acid oxidase-like deaminating enzyme